MSVEPGGVLNLFIVIVLLWTTVKIPALVGRWASQGGRGPTAFLGTVARVPRLLVACDYDGTLSRNASSINYDMDDYAGVVVAVGGGVIGEIEVEYEQQRRDPSRLFCWRVRSRKLPDFHTAVS